MIRNKVVSSNIAEIGYDKKKMTLEVQFYNLKVYQYQPVTEEAYVALMGAESIGSFFAKNIKNNKSIDSKEVKPKR